MIAGDILGERARLTPGKTALVFAATGERFTYGELNERAVACARIWMEKAGLRKGDRIGILAQNCPEFIEAFFAAGKSGIILVPLNTRLTAHEVAYIVHDSGMRALMFESQYAETVSQLRTSTAIERYIGIDATYSDADLDFASEAKKLDPNEWTRNRCEPEDTYCLLYTSGTTGKPKGVITPHRMVNWNAYNTAISWQLRDDDVSPIFTPLCHAGGVGVFLTSLFALGGTIVLHRGFDSAETWRTIETEKCTVVMGVPTIYKLLMDAREFSSVDLNSVRWFISGGAPLPLYIIEAYQKRGVTFKQGYGLTEVGVNCFAMTASDSLKKMGSIGKPMMFTEAHLVDSGLREVETGEVGELLLRGPHVCRGYWNAPEATAAALDADGWFHTGDQARQDSDGFFYIAGRSKDMFISGGVNVYPAEIEAELLLSPAVQDAAVIGVADATWGEVGIGFVVLRESHSATAADLRSFLTLRLAKFKIPREFVFVSSLPRTPYGKVVKNQLREEYERKSSSAQA